MAARVRARRIAGDVVLDADLPPGTVAFVDAGAVPAHGSGVVPALVVDDGPDAAGIAARAYAAVAAEAVAAVPQDARDRAEVTGRGVVAELVRATLGAHRRPDAPDRPAAVVETTGDAATITATLARLDDLGTLVLVGAAEDEPVATNLYEHVHVRGLTLAGVAPATTATPVPESWRTKVAAAVAALGAVPAGAPLPDGVSRYRVEARGAGT